MTPAEQADLATVLIYLAGGIALLAGCELTERLLWRWRSWRAFVARIAENDNDPA